MQALCDSLKLVEKRQAEGDDRYEHSHHLMVKKESVKNRRKGNQQTYLCIQSMQLQL
jgi:hypothetical protein